MKKLIILSLLFISFACTKQEIKPVEKLVEKPVEKPVFHIGLEYYGHYDNVIYYAVVFTNDNWKTKEHIMQTPRNKFWADRINAKKMARFVGDSYKLCKEWNNDVYADTLIIIK